MRYRVGTRGSKLALAQTKQVIEKLKSAFPEDEFDVVIIKTTGDMDQKSRLDQIGAKGIFVKEIEEELLEEKIHLAVHSMKDMPDTTADGLIFAKAWKVIGSRRQRTYSSKISLGNLLLAAGPIFKFKL